jgi:transposase
VDTIHAAHPTAQLTIWAMDEHRLGLLPVVRRIWAKRGQRPTAWVRRRYQWLYVDGFVRPTTGQSWWGLLPTVNADAMSAALAAFAADCGIDAQHRAVLVLDGAGWHTAHALVVPEGLHLVFLPPAAPELQPAERLWPLVDEPVANRTFADLDALADVLVTRCQVLAADRRRVQAHTRYHWWPTERRPRRNAP